jgi:hypothetical protein
LLKSLAAAGREIASSRKRILIFLLDPMTAITSIDVEQDASLLNDTATTFIN